MEHFDEDHGDCDVFYKELCTFTRKKKVWFHKIYKYHYYHETKNNSVNELNSYLHAKKTLSCQN